MSSYWKAHPQEATCGGCQLSLIHWSTNSRGNSSMNSAESFPLKFSCTLQRFLNNRCGAQATIRTSQLIQRWPASLYQHKCGGYCVHQGLRHKRRITCHFLPLLAFNLSLPRPIPASLIARKDTLCHNNHWFFWQAPRQRLLFNSSEGEKKTTYCITSNHVQLLRRAFWPGLTILAEWDKDSSYSVMLHLVVIIVCFVLASGTGFAW